MRRNFAIRESRKIRKKLLGRKIHRGTDLDGYCGLASILLCVALKDVTTLRSSKLNYNRNGSEYHVWNQINKTIIDITASQFNFMGFLSGYTKNKKEIKGVLITDIPHWFHPNPELSGMDVYKKIINENWYHTYNYPEWKLASEYFF